MKSVVTSAQPIPRQTPAAHAAAMRERILDGASAAFAGSGFRGTSVPAIAAAAGVSVGLIYRYFPSKEELFLAVCTRKTDATLDDLAAGLAGIANPRDRLAAAVDHFVTSLEDDNWGAIVVHAWAEADRNPGVRDMLRRLFDQLRGFAAMFIREAVARGEASPDTDVEALSLAVGMLLHGTIAYQAERGASFDATAVREALISILGRQLQR